MTLNPQHCTVGDGACCMHAALQNDRYHQLHEAGMEATGRCTDHQLHHHRMCPTEDTGSQRQVKESWLLVGGDRQRYNYGPFLTHLDANG